jgi:glyoxylate/hydroxypyruvate reductase A
MDILLSAAAHERFWDRVSGVVPTARAIRLEAGGEFVGGEPTGATVAWFTDDLYYDNLARRFFGALVRAPSLAWLQSSAAGYDAPVFARLRAAGTRLTSAHVNAIPIAEHVVRSVIDHRHGAARWRAAEKEHRWDAGPHAEVHGSTWTIVGLGSIGRAVANLAGPMGVELRGVRRHPSGDDPIPTVTPDRLAEVLRGADVVVLCTPLSESTAGLAGEEFFRTMDPGSLFVNVGRGGLVDEEALARGLDRGSPGAAALDVFATEPLPPEHPFWDDERVQVTPHIAGSSTGNAERLCDLFCANLASYVAGRPLLHEVP